MLDRIWDAPGETYGSDAYLDQFWRDAEGIDLLWKFERAQTFREPGVESWEAFDAGDIERSLLLIEEEMRPAIAESRASRRFQVQRVRVVDEPLTPYLWWELHILRIRAENGDDIRAISSDVLQGQEFERPLPEIVGLGTSVLWHVLYDESGALAGGRRVTDQAIVGAARKEVARLAQLGRPIAFVDIALTGKA